MSLRDLGDAAGIHYSYVGKLEKGTVANPSREVVRGLAIALNAPVDEFEVVSNSVV
jgi:transcriptional regulator with XRE-family HTH domain